jgi:hypothetical protein
MNKSALIFAMAAGSPACAAGQAAGAPPADKELAALVAGPAARLGKDPVPAPDSRLARALPALGLPPFSAPSDSHFGKRHASLNLVMGEQGTLHLGVLTEDTASADVLPTVHPYAKRRVFSAQVEQRFGAATAIVNAGVLRESGSLLGSFQGSALAADSAARTAFSTVALAYALTPRLALVGMASAGRSSFSAADSLSPQASPSSMRSYSLGLAARGWLAPGDRVGLALTLPARIAAGGAGLTGSALQYEDGTLGYGTRMLGSTPGGGEHDLALTYAHTLGGERKLAAAAMLRLNPNGDAGASNELQLGLRFTNKF